MSLVITKQTGNFFSLVLDSGSPIISEQNRLTTVGNLCNFKTANGANLLLKQNILVTEITVIASGTFTFATVNQLWDKLIEINFFDGTLILPPSGIDSFDELLDTFTYTGRGGQIVVVRDNELGLTTITYEIYTTAEKNKLAGIETGAQVNVNPDWNSTNPLDKRTILNKPQDAGIITYGTYSLSGQDLIINTGWVWRINNTIYTNPVPIVINFPYSAIGFQRLDLVVLNNLNSADRIAGFEVVSNPIVSPTPVNTVFFSISLVTDSDVGDQSVPTDTGENSPTTNAPVNYIPTSNTIKGNFQGIDNVLGLVYDKFTIAQIRAFSGVLKNNNIYTTDVGQEGNWYFDPNDTTSSDNTGTILVTSDGKRIKRVYVNEASVKWFGAKGDGITDDTSNINLALNSVSSVFFPVGNYQVNAVTGLIVKSNQYIKLDAKAVLQCITNSATNYNIFKIEAVSNVIIQGGSIVGDRTTHTGVTGEFGMGINILEAENITIKDMSISNCWGDGIYIGGHTLPSKRITIDNVICDNNRRQGMSITYANAVLLKNSEFKNTNGKLPQYGIDIEPNAGEYALDIEIQNCKTYGNAGGGLQVYGVSGNQNGLKVDNLQSYNNALGLNLIKGTNITFTNSNIRNNTAYGVELTKDNRDITFDKCDFKENLYMGVALVASGQVLGTEKIYFTRCSFKNNSTSDINGRDGIRIENFDNTGYIKDVFFSQCFFGNTLITPTQRYGISVEPADASISNIRIDARSLFSGNLTGAYNTVSGVLFIEQYFTNTEIAAINSKTDGTGTTDYLPKFSGAKTFVNSGIREDANGNLGINIFAPYNGGVTQKYLSINGTSVAGHAFYVDSAIAFRMAINATSSNIIETRNLPIRFFTNNTQRLSIEGNGDVKINNLSGTGDRNVVAAADGTLKIGDSRPYKVYTALITQTGTSAPLSIVLENTLGGTITWTRTGVGAYIGTFSSTWIASKTLLMLTNSVAYNAEVQMFVSGTKEIAVFTYNAIGVLADTIPSVNPSNLEIRVYP